MIGRTLYFRRDHLHLQIAAVVIAALIGDAILLSMGETGARNAMSVTVFCAGYIAMVLYQRKDPTVVIKEEHIEVNQGRLALVRYREIDAVNRVDGSRLEIVARKSGGGSEKVVVRLNELEAGDGEELAAFLAGKVPGGERHAV